MAVCRRAGTYWIDFYFQGRRYRRPAGKSKREARSALDRIRGRMATGEFDPHDLTTEAREGVTFEFALNIYLAHRKEQGKATRSYAYLSKLWRARFKGRRLETITSEEIEAALDAWADEKRWSPASRNNVLMQLSGFMSYAYGRRWISSHPIERGRVRMVEVDNARTRWLRLHEVEAIKANAPDWLQRIITFAVMTGMRLGEITALHRDSYQEDNRGRPYLVTERTKNGGRLYWPLEGEALALVAAALERTRFRKNSKGYLLGGPKGGNAESSIKRELRAAVEAAGLRWGRHHPDGITFHVFRHSMASLALNAGVPESVVMRMGNWRSRTMVKRYAHLADETLRNAAEQLACLVAGKGLNGSEKERADDLATLASK